MPDIKTAFSQAFSKAPDIQKAIAEWEDTEATPIKTEEKQVPYEYTTGTKLSPAFLADSPELSLSEVVFNHIRDNPLQGRAQIVGGLEKQGYKPASINTLISQSVLCGTILRNEQGQHTVATNKFKPVTQRMVLKARKVKQKNSAGIAALKPQTTADKYTYPTTPELKLHAPAPAIIVSDVDALLNSLTFNQAIGLYKKLKTMLGEV